MCSQEQRILVWEMVTWMGLIFGLRVGLSAMDPPPSPSPPAVVLKFNLQWNSQASHTFHISTQPTEVMTNSWPLFCFAYIYQYPVHVQIPEIYHKCVKTQYLTHCRLRRKKKYFSKIRFCTIDISDTFPFLFWIFIPVQPKNKTKDHQPVVFHITLAKRDPSHTWHISLEWLSHREETGSLPVLIRLVWTASKQVSKSKPLAKWMITPDNNSSTK